MWPAYSVVLDSAAFLLLLASFVDPSSQLRPEQTGACDFPSFLHRSGPWLFQYRMARDSSTGERLATDEVRYAEASLPNRHRMGSIGIRRYLIRLVRGGSAYKESVLEERRESIACVEASDTADTRTFLTAHYHTENSSQHLSGFMCITFEEKVDEHSRQTFATSVYLGPVEPHRFPIGSCHRGELNDKWVWTPEPNMASFRSIQCPQKFSFKTIIDWVDAADKSAPPKTLNTRSGLGIVQENTFALVQSQCIFGLGMSWLFYNEQPDNYRRSAILSLKTGISTQYSIQEDMKCAGSWVKHSADKIYHFTLIYHPEFPMSIYTLRVPLDRDLDGSASSEDYREAMLYEGAAEVLSPGLGSSLAPTRGHLLSRDEFGHNRFLLTYRKSIGDCDNHIRGCLFSDMKYLGNSMNLRTKNCKFSSDLDGNPCAMYSNPGSCTYNDDIAGSWVRPQRDRFGLTARVRVGVGANRALMSVQHWDSAQFPATEFICRKKFALMGTYLPEGVYVIQRAPDKMCAATKSCMQVIPTAHALSASGAVLVNRNVLFMRISHDTALSENEVPRACTFKEKVLSPKTENSTMAEVAVSYFHTLLSESLARPIDEFQMTEQTPTSMYCKMNLYAKYNFSTAKSRFPCLLTIASDSKAYDSFSFNFVKGSARCDSDLDFMMRKHTCLGGYDINTGAFNPRISPVAFLFHVVITYFVESNQKFFNCWLIEKTVEQSVSKMLLFDSAQCRLLFAADAHGESESSAHLEAVDEAAVVAALYNPASYPEEAQMQSIVMADNERLPPSRHRAPGPAGSDERSQRQPPSSSSGGASSPLGVAMGDGAAAAAAAAATGSGSSRGGGRRGSSAATTTAAAAAATAAASLLAAATLGWAGL